MRAAADGRHRAGRPDRVRDLDEAQLLTTEMLTPVGTADAERLGVHPWRMADVLGA
jgi:hypothetical protein